MWVHNSLIFLVVIKYIKFHYECFKSHRKSDHNNLQSLNFIWSLIPLISLLNNLRESPDIVTYLHPLLN